MSSSFTQFPLNQDLIQSLSNHQFMTPTPIQEQVIPLALEGKDVLAQAETGSGKTGAFVIPLIHLVQQKMGLDKEGKEQVLNAASPYYLVLAPTRELAQQISSVAEKFGAPLGVKSICVIGGERIFEQKKSADEGIHILVATPGRLTDLYNQKIISFRDCVGIVLDEVDRLFDMGFKDEIHYLLSQIPKGRQLLMFTATHNLEVLNMAYKFRSDPVEIRLNEDKLLVENIQHSLIHLGDGEKMRLLVGLLRQSPEAYVIIFSNTQRQTHLVERWLNELGFKVKGISGSLPQNRRTKLMEQFRQKEIQILVSTDVAARGLDIKDVNLVINYDLPSDPSNYVHRIGRTGRAGKDGRAISFCAYRDCEFLGPIEDYIKGKIPVEEIDEKQLATDIGHAPPESDDSGDQEGSAREGSRRPTRGHSENRGNRGPGPGRGNGNGTQKRNHMERARGARGPARGPRRDEGNRDGGFRGDRDNYGNREGGYRDRDGNREGNREGNRDGNRDNGYRAGNRDGGSRGGGRNFDGRRRFEDNRGGRGGGRPQQGGGRGRRFERAESELDLRPKRRIFETTTTNMRAAEEEAIKFFRLDDDSLIGHRVVEEGKRRFFGLGAKEVRVEFFVKPDFEVLLSTFLVRLFKLMNVNIEAQVTYVPPLATVNLTGAEEALLGESDGELLAAIDHVIKKYLGKLVDLAPDFKLRLQSEGLVRDKEKSLQELAERTKAKVLESGRPVILDPLSPSDRRMIHQFLDQDEEVTTRSLGHGHFKRIKIELLSGEDDHGGGDEGEGQDDNQDEGYDDEDNRGNAGDDRN